MGINQPNPQFSIDVGGLVADSIIRASGFIDGGSGILFSGGQLTDTLLTASGGRQYEPFLRNRVGTASNGVIQLSGVVDQIIDFANQPPATIFAGPASGWCGTPPCSDDVPTFRQLVVSDLPNQIVNQSGQLILPVVTSTTGSYPNVVLKDAGDNVIQPGPGVVVIAEGVFGTESDNSLIFAKYDSGASKYVWFRCGSATLL